MAELTTRVMLIRFLTRGSLTHVGNLTQGNLTHVGVRGNLATSPTLASVIGIEHIRQVRLEKAPKSHRGHMA